jgi:hypothetical protein
MRLRENNGTPDDSLQFPNVTRSLVLKSIVVVVRHRRLLTSVSKSCAKGFALAEALMEAEV